MKSFLADLRSEVHGRWLHIDYGQEDEEMSSDLRRDLVSMGRPYTLVFSGYDRFIANMADIYDHFEIPL
jgi:hypothetical protein